jgi:hypothetical protein
LEKLWDGLAADDPVTAYKAVWVLAARPKESVPFLRERMKTVTATTRRMAQLATDLGSPKFKVRRKASVELGKVVELAEPALRRAWAGEPSLDVRKRLEEFLAKLKIPLESAEQWRRLRVMEVLARIETAEARRLLADLGQGTNAAR